PLFTGLAWRIPGSTGDLRSYEYDDQGSAASYRSPLVCWRPNSPRCRVCVDIDVSTGARNHGNYGVNVVHRVQVRGYLQRVPRRTVGTDCPVQHRLLPIDLHA